MDDQANPKTGPRPSETKVSLLEIAQLQKIEGNPLQPDEIAMFEMFEREGWGDERQLAHINALIDKRIAGG